MVGVNVKTVRIGVLGGGNVGGALVELISRDREAIARRTGIDLDVRAVAVRSIGKPRPFAIPEHLLTTSPADVVTSSEVDLIVECIGGIEPARTLITQAIELGKPVITGNKELLANMGHELFELADAQGTDLLFEAAVAGGIPLVRALRQSLVGEHLTKVMGIMNGTTNYILSEMTERGVSYREALSEAQALGFAEQDPTADVEGFDAGAKIAIAASIAFGSRIVAGDVYHEGISTISQSDIEYAGQMGFRIKLLAIAERFADETVAVRVHPTMVPLAHPLAAVSGSFNAVFVEGPAVDQLMFYGRGAGGYPSGSAVLGDLLDAADTWIKGTHTSFGTLERRGIRSIDEMSSAFYVNLEVADAPGVLAAVARVFGDHGVSIRSMEQEPIASGARLVFITHATQELSLRNTLKGLSEVGAVHSVNSVVRVLEMHP